MSAQTQSLTYDDNPNFVIYRPNRLKTTEINLRKNLDIQQSESLADYHSYASTDSNLKEIGNTLLVKLVDSLPSKGTLHPVTIKRNEIEGTIIGIEDVSVLCEVYIDVRQERTMTIRLHRSLFPENIHYGLPITIAYRKDISGFKRPSVTIRKLAFTEHMREENNEIEDLINSL